jgi:murein DD-endopeptidase MepM/ murein hydrolase activator NlpD
VTYRVYIKKDYKTKVERIGGTSSHLYFFKIVCFVVLAISTYFMFDTDPSDRPESKPVISEVNLNSKTPETSITSHTPIANFVADNIESQNEGNTAVDSNNVLDDEVTDSDTFQDDGSNFALDENTPDISEVINPWQSVTVKPGDSLALIFSRLGLSPTSLYNIMSLGKEVSNLKRIQPGQVLKFHIEDNELLALNYEMKLTKSLNISKENNAFKAEVIHIELEKVVNHASAVINDSLFLSAKRSGLSDNLIMQLVSVYGWDIDFALDIREGDSFTVIYEEQYKDGVKVSDGPIIAAEFVNRNTPLRAVRYTHEDGRVDYYADNGDAMRKAFLRTPVELARISSRFNLRRKHPILNRIRAHKGVDYAASTGTPIKATGDGTVIHAGKKGGYGKTVILKHGGKYSTLYAHLHKYARGVRSGSRVKQGQIIGYVGKSGLATGPHLHYEFRVHGVHRNPLTVKLPKVESISNKALPEFKTKTNPMLVELDRLTGKSAIAVQQTETPINLAAAKMEDG